MTKVLPFTELAVRRAIAAAKKENLEPGWSVTAHPDGSITVSRGIETPLAPSDNEAERQRWGDIEA